MEPEDCGMNKQSKTKTRNKSLKVVLFWLKLVIFELNEIDCAQFTIFSEND